MWSATFVRAECDGARVRNESDQNFESFAKWRLQSSGSAFETVNVAASASLFRTFANSLSSTGWRVLRLCS